MTNSVPRAPIWAIRLPRIAFFALLLVNLSEASTAWFSTRGSVNSHKLSYTTVLRLDSVPMYSGALRQAPEFIERQTFTALKLSLESWYHGADTMFNWSYNSWQKVEPHRFLPISANAVRAGQAHNEWVAWTLHKPSPLHFHSPYYGMGQHDALAPCIPEEQLWLEATLLPRSQATPQFCVLGSISEQSYVRRTWKVVGSATGQKAVFDDITCEMVRFDREDGAVMEVWVSPQSLQIIRLQSFGGTQYQRFQYEK